MRCRKGTIAEGQHLAMNGCLLLLALAHASGEKIVIIYLSNGLDLFGGLPSDGLLQVYCVVLYHNNDRYMYISVY